jgi:hypothetical protein
VRRERLARNVDEDCGGEARGRLRDAGQEVADHQLVHLLRGYDQRHENEQTDRQLSQVSNRERCAPPLSNKGFLCRRSVGSIEAANVTGFTRVTRAPTKKTHLARAHPTRAATGPPANFGSRHLLDALHSNWPPRQLPWWGGWADAPDRHVRRLLGPARGLPGGPKAG